MTPRCRAEGQHISCRCALAERADDVLPESALAARAVKPLANDDQDPPVPALLVVAHKPQNSVIGFRRGHPMQIAFCLDFEPRVRQGVDNAGVGRVAVAEDTSVAVALHQKWHCRRVSGRDRRASRSALIVGGHHALLDPSAKRLDVRERLPQRVLIGLRASAARRRATLGSGAFSFRLAHDPTIMNPRPAPAQLAHPLQLTCLVRRIFARHLKTMPASGAFAGCEGGTSLAHEYDRWISVAGVGRVSWFCRARWRSRESAADPPTSTSCGFGNPCTAAKFGPSD